MTTRCLGARFRLRPDAERRDRVAYHLGVALKKYPEMRLHAKLVMSNHLHMVLTDPRGELSAFMEAFLGPLAKTLNRLDGTRGPVFETRFKAEEIVDDDALLERIAYTVTNPVAAGLVESVEAWRGLTLWQVGETACEGLRFRKRSYEEAVRRARRDGGPPVDREGYVDRVQVRLTPVELEGRDATSELRAMVAERLVRLAAERGRRRVLGMRRVLRQDVFAAPEAPKRTPQPLCHASTPEGWRSYRDGWRRFVQAYREASAAFRAGYLTFPFPAYSFRPPTPLVI